MLTRPTYWSLLVRTTSATSGRGGVAGHGTGGGTVGVVGLLRRVLGRRRETADAQVEKLCAPAAVGPTHRQHGMESRAGHRRLEVLDQEVLVDGLTAEVAVHQRLVLGLLDDRLDERSSSLVLDGAAQQSGHPLAVGYDDRQHPLAERVPHRSQGAVEVGASVVELGHHDGARHLHRLALPPQLAGVLVDVLVGRHHEERAVRGAQPGPHLAHEVGVSGGVDEVDLAPVVHHRRDGERAGPLVRALAVLVVAHRVVLGDGAGPRHGTRRRRAGTPPGRSCPTGWDRRARRCAPARVRTPRDDGW